jgi:regulator of protease activity HflC (stomatin/prohibitin superfamily)
MDLLKEYWWALALVLAFLSSFVTVNQGFIGVVTMFGKYRRILRPGLNLKIPLFEQIFKKVSIQNRSVELEFQAVTIDQANVYFKSMLLYSVQNEQEETIQKVAFKFISDKDLMQALIRTVEGSIRAFVSTKKQAEVLNVRRDIVENVKEQVDVALEGWGYHLQDLQINDITFDEAIITSMSKVVASNNLKAAAENEGQALLITKTKAAEAEGNAIKIAAEGCGTVPGGSGQRYEPGCIRNETGKPGYQCHLIQHVGGSDQEFCRIWQRQCDILRRRQRWHGKNHEADNGHAATGIKKINAHIT